LQIPANLRPARKGRFEAQTQYVVRVSDIGRLNEIVNRTIGSGQFELDQLSFSVADADSAEIAARKDAVGKAKRRAIGLAEAADVILGDLLDITDGESYGSESMADLPAPDTTEIIPPETLSFRGSVTMTWRIKSAGPAGP
jgi:uncharacterized protein YggE